MFSEPQVVLTFIIALIGGGGLVGLATAVSSHWLGKQRLDVDMTTVITDGFNVLLENQRAENDRLLARISELELSVIGLQSKIVMLEDYIKDSGMAMPEWKSDE